MTNLVSSPDTVTSNPDLDSAIPAVYAELRRLARSYLRHERSGHTLQTTALVHEAYLRLLGQHKVDWNNRQQLIGLAAHLMRRVLLKHAAARGTQKRGGLMIREELSDDAHGVAASPDAALEVQALNRALETLEVLDPRQGRIVELRYFGGLTIAETAAALDLSPATVKREWHLARVWLWRALHSSTVR